MSSLDRGPKTKFRRARRVIFALQFTVDALILLMKLYEGDRAKGCGRTRIALGVEITSGFSARSCDLVHGRDGMLLKAKII